MATRSAAIQGESDLLTRDDLKQQEQRARRFWVSIIVGFLSLQVVIGIVSIVLSVSDPTVAVIPNYHQRALDWDITHRARTLATQLGWQIDYNVVPSEKAGARSLLVSIVDRDGQPLPALNVNAKLYRHARGSAVDTFKLIEVGAGNYQADTKLHDKGLWQIELTIEGEHGIASLSRELEVK